MDIKSRFKKIGIPAIISLALIIGTSFLFILYMNKMISAHTVNTINELAEHDMSAIIQFVDSNWHSLRNIGNRIKEHPCESFSELQEKLNLERRTSDFQNMFFIDEDDIIYSDRNYVYKNDELRMLSKLNWQGRDEIVRRYDFSGEVDREKEMLLYAIKLYGYKINGKKIVALVGISNINTMQDNLIIYYFHSDEDDAYHGYSSIVNYSGDYIVNRNKALPHKEKQNLFELLDAGDMSGDWTSEMVADKMVQNETFRLAYKDEFGVHKLLYFMPIDRTPWYFISAVENRVFTEQRRSFVVISVSMVVVALGITAAMLLLVANSRQEAMFARAETKARSKFLSNMSHEIRTPLNGVIGLLYLMRTHLHDYSVSQMNELIEKADDSAQYLLSLVSDILDMSKLHAEKLKLNPEPFRLDKMISSVGDMQKSNAENQGVSLKLNLNISSPNVVGDETRLKQVLMNIIGNSVKFTPAGGVISINVTQKEVIDEHVDTTIICSDTGVGMSDEFQKTIWDSFTQEHNKFSSGVRGTGLGMAITKGIIDAMGGTITVKSKLNEGSTFIINVRLPVTESAALSDDQSGEETEQQALLSGEGIKLIVAEDNELNAEILSEILQSKGFTVAFAENGRIAVDIFDRSKPNEYHAILMDMQMPVMDGCEATKKIRELNRPDAQTIKIFACTANVFQEDKDKAIESGMNDFLIKPIDVNVLLSKLKK